MLIWSNLAKKILSGDTEVSLEDLVGPHWLSGVDETRIRIDDDYINNDSDVITFILDDITFSAVEDPDDGYRSSMRELVIGGYKCDNIFSPIPVVCKMSEKNDATILEVYWENHLILEVGTDHSDNYYPYFVGYWDPTKIEFKTYE